MTLEEDLRSSLRGITDYIEILEEAIGQDFPYRLYSLRPIKEMLPIWREALKRED